MAFAPTPEQKAAIGSRGGSLLLSAAAGSGKTAVLTQRAVSRMLDPVSPVAADRLLIVTFTRAAAAEMKERIVRLLLEWIAAHPGDEWARRQRVLLDRASIGTIHSLCAELLRQNFGQAFLPAAFRVGDESELAAMQSEILDGVLEESYREQDPDFLSLASLLSSSRDDTGLAGAVLRVLGFARSHPFYRRWLSQKLTLYRELSSPRDSVWAKILFAYGEQLADCTALRLSDALETIGANEELAGYAPAFQSDLAAALAVKKAAAANDWDGCRSALVSYSPQRLGQARKSDASLREEVKRIRDHAKKTLSETLPRQVFCATEAEFSEDVADLLPKIECLFSLVLKTDERLTAEKLSRGVLDFTDLEQLTCSLLVGENNEPTPLAREYAAQFDEVMVDEFQDVNEVQNAILTALSGEDHLFCVGDVKQSIYRFRMAQPRLFLKKAAACREYDGVHYPAVIRLNGSFRTAPAVTRAVNEAFSALMSDEIGEITYDERHCLIPLGSFSPEVKAGVRLCLVRDDPDTADAEPAWVAGEIARLLREGTVSDGNTSRRIEPRDIAILLRSAAGHADAYRRALAKAGIDAAFSQDGGFLDAPEIAAVLNVLYAAVNPLRDVELLGAMTSPMFGFTDDELAAIRIGTPKGPLWGAVCAAGKENAHAALFVSEMNTLRRLSQSELPAALIGDLLARTGFDALCRAGKDGEKKSANLALLLQYAAEPCGGRTPSLTSFLRRIALLRERKKDLAPAQVGGAENAVTITSIHRSKGLEWPVVFVCGCAQTHAFYRNDLSLPTLLHSELGFASVRRDPACRRQFVTVPLAALRTQAEREFLSEELRVLYVAMTRAKEKLYLTAISRSPEEKLLSAAQETAGQTTLLPVQVRAGRCFLDWLLLSWSLRHDLSAMADTGREEDGLSAAVCEAPVLEEIPPAEEQALPPPDEELLSLLTKRLERPDPHAAAARLPAKLSVSELSHGGESLYFTSRPSFLSNGALTGAQRGTAMHTFFQYCDFALAAKDAAAEISRLHAIGVLTAAQADAIAPEKVQTFFQSALFSRISRAGRVLREFRFMAPASASALSAQYALPDGEASMLQGVADCILIEEDGAVLIDYKTDRIREEEELVRRYRTQLLLYRDMLSGVLNVPVREAVLWSFSLGRAIDVPF